MRKLKIFALCVSIGATLSLSAQSKLYLWQNGNKIVYEVSTVDSITFSDEVEEPEPPSEVYLPDAKTLAKEMFTGINIGNTLESTDNGAGWCPDGETCWGSPKITKEMVQMYKNAGFNTIRIPVAWHAYLSDATNFVIKESWANRVNEVVDYCIDEGLFVIINIHWDNGWLENNCTLDKQDAVNIEQAALWKQIAERYKDYDGHLIFASANEPNVDDAEQAAVLKSYHQTFVNTVRNSGGNNGKRCIIIQGPRTDIEKSVSLDVMPTDVIADRMLFEVHYYPYTYALMEEDADWGNVHYFWGKDYQITINGVNRTCDWNNEEKLTADFASMKTAFVDKGIPVILGEYAVMNRDLTSLGGDYQQKFLESKAYYYEFLNKTAKNNGIVPILWETPDNIFDRETQTILDPIPLEGIMKGSNAGNYPF